eukprot:gene15418-biopygen84357
MARYEGDAHCPHQDTIVSLDDSMLRCEDEVQSPIALSSFKATTFFDIPSPDGHFRKVFPRKVKAEWIAIRCMSTHDDQGWRSHEVRSKEKQRCANVRIGKPCTVPCDMTVFTKHLDKFASFLDEVYPLREANWENAKSVPKPAKPQSEQDPADIVPKPSKPKGKHSMKPASKRGSAAAAPASSKRSAPSASTYRRGTVADIDDALLRLGMKLSLEALRDVDKAHSPDSDIMRRVSQRLAQSRDASEMGSNLLGRPFDLIRGGN